MKTWSIVVGLSVLSAAGCQSVRRDSADRVDPTVIASPQPATKPSVSATASSTRPVTRPTATMTSATPATTAPSTRPTPPIQPAAQPTTSRSTAPFLPGNENVVSIVTRPTVASQPTTQRSTAGGNMTAAAEAATPRLALTELAKIDTSIATAPLLRLLAMKLNSIPYDRFVGYGALDFVPNLPEGTQPDKITTDILSREPAEAGVAIGRLTAGEIAMAFATRAPTAEEIDAAAKQKVQLRADVIATEALVFTLNNANPVKNMSAAKLKEVFSGKAKAWSDLQLEAVPLNSELASKPVTVAYRARGLGAEELTRQLLLGGEAMPELPVSKALSTTKLVMDATKEDSETIGFSGFCYVTNMQRDGKVRLLAVDGVLPEPARVASGEYPLTTPLYVITRTDLDSKSDLAGLRTWLSAMPGQRALAEAGYMPVASEAWSQQRLTAE